MRQTGNGFIVAFALAASALCGATGGIEMFAGRAEIVAVGAMVEGTQNGPQVYLSLRPDRVLKGTLPLGVPVPISWQSPVRHKGAPVHFPEMYGLWFLGPMEGAFRRLLPGAMIIPFDFYPALREPPSGAFAYRADSPMAEKVALELCAAANRFSGDAKVASIMLRDFLGLLGLDSPSLRGAYRALSASRNADTAALGLGSLILLGDISALEQASERAAELQGSKSFWFVVRAVRFAVPTDPAAARAIGRWALAETADPELRRAAAYSLRAAHTAAAMPYLGRLLGHADADVRHLAVAGVSAYMHNLPSITVHNTRSMAWMRPAGPKRYEDSEIEEHLQFGSLVTDAVHSNRIVSFWQNWWGRNAHRFPEE